ncbi:hypothetical protein [Kineococcus aurantiacus]|uniref:SRPBCC family protein n=1 Tax=Kineococcus aurantiacus TaxID=37633 RepID=A0A7Y9J1F1_9ACTN|nr:hypothetical protein [Kineococcus aurantiacus]NYD23003.1 hypothetical protein [Kineococcus aurantiacus]
MRRLAEKAATAAGNAVLHRGGTAGPRRQTLTLTRPVENVLRACQDPDVLSTVLRPAGEVTRDGAGRFAWSLGGDGQEVLTEVSADPNRVVFRTTGPDPTEVLVVEAWPEPRWGGSEVVVQLDLPGGGGLGEGAAAFTFLYRLRALLQTGEVPTLGRVPSGRRSGQEEH